ncbi:MAG: glycogen synthase GlgA [Leptothrix sp. (in: b-proteobacteria)]
MRTLQVCAEIFPLLKTGGLADVAGALPPALAARGVEVRVLLPGFDAILAGLQDAAVVAELPAHFGGVAGARLLYGRLPACDAVGYVIDAPGLYRRPGGPYADAQQQPYADNHLRFALLGWVAAELTAGLDRLWQAQVVHAHDWHAALAAPYLRALERRHGRRLAGCVYTVHNLAYQGFFPADHYGALGLPWDFYGMHGLEFHGQISFMKGGLYFADRITTVSPTYAREIQGAEQGCGLDGLLRDRRLSLSGILNGVDDAVWNPASDALIASHFDTRRLPGKARCKAALQKLLGLQEQADVPLFCIVSRITEQKGLHLVLQALPGLIGQGAQFALLGSGDAGMEAAFKALAQQHPGQVAVRLGYDEPFAHQLIAGSDVIMVPSRYEPCGLTQLYGLKYGTLPLVRRVGGLADTVSDTRLETLDTEATGFVFDDFSAEALLATAVRAQALYRRRSDWQLVQRRAMQQTFNWEGAAARYEDLYHQVAA